MSQTKGIDPRGARFTAAITAVVFAVVLLGAPAAWALVLLGVQVTLFAIGAARGAQAGPVSAFFRVVVRPRLAPPAELEDPAPPRFAQTVGLGFAVVSLLGYLAGADALGAVAAGLALMAALLNAVFGFCLGCEMYLLGKRLSARPVTNFTQTS